MRNIRRWRTAVTSTTAVSALLLQILFAFRNTVVFKHENRTEQREGGRESEELRCSYLRVVREESPTSASPLSSFVLMILIFNGKCFRSVEVVLVNLKRRDAERRRHEREREEREGGSNGGDLIL